MKKLLMLTNAVCCCEVLTWHALGENPRCAGNPLHSNELEVHKEFISAGDRLYSVDIIKKHT